MDEKVAMTRPFHILPLAANTAEELAAKAARLADQPWKKTVDSAETERPFRAVVLASGEAEMRQQLWALAGGQHSDAPGLLVSAGPVTEPPPVAFLFTGHGAQYVGMARDLYRSEPRFRQALDACDKLLGGDLLPILYPASDPGEASPLLTGMTYSQPALFAIEYALASLWRAWGIQPTAVTGHSVGEYAAACAAGVLNLEDGLRLVAARGRLMDGLPQKGQMVAVFADEEQVRAAIAPYADQVSIAVVNGPKNVVISGASEAVEEAVAALQAQRIRVRRLAVAQASHSPLVDPMLDEFEALAAGMELAAPQVTYVSGVMGTAVNGQQLTQPAYWRQHQRQAVRFSDAMQTLFATRVRHFVEIGPDSTLLGIARRLPIPEGAEIFWLPSLVKGQDAWVTLLHSLATLYVQGVAVDWVALRVR